MGRLKEEEAQHIKVWNNAWTCLLVWIGMYVGLERGEGQCVSDTRSDVPPPLPPYHSFTHSEGATPRSPRS